MISTPPLRAGDLLAAYGLLRPGAHGLDRLRLRARVRPLGPCRIPGRLIDLGGHPALVAGPGEVAGDLLALEDAAAGAVLDAFEDFDRADPAGSIYRRARLRLLRPPVHAWVYLWNGAPDAGPPIPGGDWLRRSSGVRRSGPGSSKEGATKP
jgi:gamma-glutamylcyclotransferase (GGCT)/AIG2-like uncharacterized protein YtfP